MAQIFQSDGARIAAHSATHDGSAQQGPQNSQLSELQQKADDSQRSRELGAIQRKAETVQRQPEEEEPLQGRAQGHTLQLQEEEEALQGKAVGQALQNAPEDAAVQMKPSGSGSALPRQLQTGLETLSGQSMDHVRVHRNSNQPAAVGAHAFAQGSDIHLAPGQERHLPHEAWHTVQQAQGRVQTTGDLGGVALNDSPALEREADTRGDKAAGK